VLLSALLACAAGKCYSYSNVILDGPDIQDRHIYIYGLSNVEVSAEKSFFLIQSNTSLPLLWNQIFISMFTESIPLSPF
jgi:hypothetical protein